MNRYTVWRSADSRLYFDPLLADEDMAGGDWEKIQVIETQPLVEAVEKLREAWMDNPGKIEFELQVLEKLVSSP